MNTSITPQFQSFHLEGVNHITSAEAWSAMENGTAVMIDVRELAEVEGVSIPHHEVLYHPMSVIVDRLPHIPTDKLLIVVCTTGLRSVRVAHLFNVQGFKQVANLDGGLVQWATDGFPIEEGQASSCGCGCDCSSSEPTTQSVPSASCGCDCSGGCC